MSLLNRRTLLALGIAAAVLLGLAIWISVRSGENDLHVALAAAQPPSGAVAVFSRNQLSRLTRNYVVTASATDIEAHYVRELSANGWRVVAVAADGLCAERGSVRLRLAYSNLPPGSYTYSIDIDSNRTCSDAH